MSSKPTLQTVVRLIERLQKEMADMKIRLEAKIDFSRQDAREQLHSAEKGIYLRLDKVENRLGNVENRLGNVENRLGNVENRLGNVENRLGKVEGRLDYIEVAITETRKDLRVKLNNHETRIATLETAA